MKADEPPSRERLLTFEEVGERLGKTAEAVRKDADRGKWRGAVVKVGRLRRIKESALNQFIASLEAI